MKITQNAILNLISWIQIIGGITGLGLIAYLLIQTDTINGPTLLIYQVGISLFIFSIYAGKTLCYNADKKNGLILTVINQLFQLFQWSMLGYSFSYSAGAELMVGIKGLSISFNFAAIVSTFSMSINSHHEFFLKVNVISIVVLIFSIKSYKELKRNTAPLISPVSPDL